ncbi:hypothetical protein BTO20_14875 [Mycobacterium dioxanotrophicus]|uniref:HTH cro/C1-type domain-containing protein n=1 Tax=Mycobacterium dioxanotrophicus TaxID=482462 RepID=A0A1Y0C3I0_9MYCO|nr:helix-turn-helix domain-containing protein [Mycobacterium dioxanotrophicus]ART69702.1 hypothetical protein BTO20_14875 [Mycobacterium dioxanotrophicus]
MEKPPPDTTIADNVRAELARRQVSNSALAELLGLSLSAVSRRTRGETPFRDWELKAIADHLGVPVATLFKKRYPGMRVGLYRTE